MQMKETFQWDGTRKRWFKDRYTHRYDILCRDIVKLLLKIHFSIDLQIYEKSPSLTIHMLATLDCVL